MPHGSEFMIFFTWWCQVICSDCNVQKERKQWILMHWQKQGKNSWWQPHNSFWDCIPQRKFEAWIKCKESANLWFLRNLWQHGRQHCQVIPDIPCCLRSDVFFLGQEKRRSDAYYHLFESHVSLPEVDLRWDRFLFLPCPEASRAANVQASYQCQGLQK